MERYSSMELGSPGWFITMFVGGIGLGVAVAAAWHWMKRFRDR